MKVGITGHQIISDPEWVSAAIRKTLASFQTDVTGFTSLAAGADQLFAKSVLEAGGELTAIIPFEDYEEVFDSSEKKIDYNALLNKVKNKIILKKQKTNEESYLLAGMEVVNLSDLLIAVWNGKPAKGLGGTADIVEYAIHNKKPLIHINPETLEIISIKN